mgnify:CR=1 FL=1
MLFTTSFSLGVLLNWFYSPLPTYSGEITLPTIQKEVEVYTDTYGVPHIFAENEKDLFFVAGYIAARERLFQLSMVALAVKGELASILGDSYIKTDVYLRTWRIEKVAVQLVKAMDPKNKIIFESFCEGINYWIKESKNDLPIEFKILGMEPLFWDPVIVAGYTRMMAHEMSGSWKPEIVFGAIAEYFGESKLLELIPGGEYDLPSIAKISNQGMTPFYTEVLGQEMLLRNLFGDFSADIGSNSWVISGQRTKTGKPLLANDPHLAFSQPPRWYEIYLKGGRFNVSGFCLAGIPIPVIGQNQKTAWGFTNSMVDDLDFFIEKINPENKDQYFHDGKWKRFLKEKERIPLKSGKDTTIVVRTSVHGPVISDIHPLLKGGDKVVSMSWTGHWITKEMDAWISMTTMKNWNDFSSAIKNFGVPGQNIVYADSEGNIGWRPAVYVPMRKEGYSLIPRPGHLKEYDWAGKIPYGKMPYLYNPSSGFIATANNKTIGEGFPYYISGLWADPSRAARINALIEKNWTHTSKDMELIQLDYISSFALEVLPTILAVNQEGLTENQKVTFSHLKEWNGKEDVGSKGALFFHSFLNKFITNLYKDELGLLGDGYFEAYMSLKYLTHRNLREILSGKQSSWLDDINTTNKYESLEDIIIKSYGEAYSLIVNTYGPDMENWKWGDAHFLTHKHILGKVKIFDYLLSLNIGPFKSGGSSLTPNAGGYAFGKDFQQTSGASMRRIVDFSNLNKTKSILPTGQSGLQRSPHYSDQASIYHSGRYRTIKFDERAIKRDNKMRKLTLIPSEKQ